MAKVDLSEFYLQRECSLEKILNNLSTEEGEKLVAAIAEPSLPMARIIEWLRNRNINTSEKTITKHRRNECHCGKVVIR